MSARQINAARYSPSTICRQCGEQFRGGRLCIFAELQRLTAQQRNMVVETQILPVSLRLRPVAAPKACILCVSLSNRR